MNVIFSIKVNGQIFLINPENAHDEYMYITQMINGTGELRFQKITETVPQKRLERLLRKANFEEAEKFALEYNLDMEQIKKAKAQAILDKTICSENDIQELISILDTIADTCFKLQSVIDVSSESYVGVRSILNYGCNISIPEDEVLIFVCIFFKVLTNFFIFFRNIIQKLVLYIITFVTFYLDLILLLHYREEIHQVVTWKLGLTFQIVI